MRETLSGFQTFFQAFSTHVRFHHPSERSSWFLSLPQSFPFLPSYLSPSLPLPPSIYLSTRTHALPPQPEPQPQLRDTVEEEAHPCPIVFFFSSSFFLLLLLSPSRLIFVTPLLLARASIYFPLIYPPRAPSRRRRRLSIIQYLFLLNLTEPNYLSQ